MTRKQKAKLVSKIAMFRDFLFQEKTMKKTSTKPATETQPSKQAANKSIKVIRILFRGTCPKLTARSRGANSPFP